MRVLGIETSCDETAVCLLEARGTFDADFAGTILGNALASQAALHAQYGGVFPNVAKREHQKNLVPILEHALTEADMLHVRPQRPTIDVSDILHREQDLLAQLQPFLDRYERPDIDAIAVTHGPGLEPALWVGVNFAKALSAAWQVSLVAVNHMEGHVLASTIDLVGQSFELKTAEFPLVSLLISGGHTEIVLSKEFMQYERIGQTRDDAAGEAFDKVARLLDLPYPGGPEISRLAEEARRKISQGEPLKDPKGSPWEIHLPRPMLREDNLDFSFAGLKTAVRRIVEAHQPLTDDQKLQLAREFEDAAADVLVEKTVRAAHEYGALSVLVGGGVSANTHIRRQLSERLKETGITLFTPPPGLSTDNAIMIALAGYFHAERKEFVDPADLHARGNLRLGM